MGARATNDDTIMTRHSSGAARLSVEGLCLRRFMVCSVFFMSVFNLSLPSRVLVLPCLLPSLLFFEKVT